MTLDTYGKLMDADLAGAADALDREIRATAVSLRSQSTVKPSKAS